MKFFIMTLLILAVRDNLILSNPEGTVGGLISFTKYPLLNRYFFRLSHFERSLKIKGIICELDFAVSKFKLFNFSKRKSELLLIFFLNFDAFVIFFKEADIAPRIEGGKAVE